MQRKRPDEGGSVFGKIDGISAKKHIKSSRGEDRTHFETLPDPEDLQRGAHFVGQGHGPGLPAAGKVDGQGPHVGLDDVALHLGQVGQGAGVAEGELRVVQALVAGWAEASRQS